MRTPFAITNEADNTVLRAIEHASKGSETIRVAVAYVDSDGVRDLVEVLENEACRDVRILLGASNTSNPPEALHRLLRFEAKNRDSKKDPSIVRVSKLGPLFHQKLYLFSKGSECTAIIGSANATGKGLNRQSEVAVMLTGQEKKSPFAELIDNFEFHFDHDMCWPLEKVIENLEEAYNTEKRRKKKGTNQAWKRFLARTRRPAPRKWEKDVPSWLIETKGAIPRSDLSKAKKAEGWSGLDYFSASPKERRHFRRNNILCEVYTTKSKQTFTVGIIRGSTTVINPKDKDYPIIVGYKSLGSRTLKGKLMRELTASAIIPLSKRKKYGWMNLLTSQQTDKIVEIMKLGKHFI